MLKKCIIMATLALSQFGPQSAMADSTKAKCDYAKNGQKLEGPRKDCTFSQSQGYVSIVFDDGTRFDFSPDADGNYTDDATGKPVQRFDEPQDADELFKTAKGWVYVWWE